MLLLINFCVFCKIKVDLKKRDLKECKLEIMDLVSENKSLRSEMISKEQQVYCLKEKLHEQGLEMSSNYNGRRDLSPFKRNGGLTCDQVIYS